MRLEIPEWRGGVESLAPFKFEQSGHFVVSRLKSLPPSWAGELDSGFQARGGYLGGWFQGLSFLILPHVNSLCSQHTDLTAKLVRTRALGWLFLQPGYPFLRSLLHRNIQGWAEGSYPKRGLR